MLGNNNNQANTPQPPRGGLLKEVEKIEVATQTIQAYLPRLSASKIIRDGLFYLWGGILLFMLAFSTLFNLFLDFYYAVPEVSRYVQTYAMQVALTVNTEIPAQIEADYQKQFAQVPSNSLAKGIEANFRAGEEIKKLNVKGALFGKAVNEIIGTVEARPIRFTQNYQQGMQANYVTGDKYYDVNLTVAGWQKGLIVSQQGEDELYEMNLFTASLGLVEQVDQALRLNLNKFLNQANDREMALRSYLTYLHNLQNSITNTQPKVTRQINYFSKMQKSAQAKMTKTESDFFTAMQKFDENKTYANLDQFVEDHQAEVDQKAHLQAMTQIDKYFQAYLPILEERITAVEANREALVKGVTVVAFREVDLGLIKNQ